MNRQLTDYRLAHKQKRHPNLRKRVKIGYEGVPSKWDFAYCIFFTNQAGTVISSFSGSTLMLVTFLFNLYFPNFVSTSTWIIQQSVLHFYLIVMMAGFILAFIAAFNEVGVCAEIAAYIVAIGALMYLGSFAMSFLTESMLMLYVCPGMRCADHHWLQDALWRGYVIYTENIQKLHEVEAELMRIESQLNSPHKFQFREIEYDESLEHENRIHPKYVVLRNVLGTNYFPEDSVVDISGKRNRIIEPNNNQRNNLDIGNMSVQYTTPLPIGRPGEAFYIRVLTTKDEGNKILTICSCFFFLFTFVFFLYSSLTFFAYGRQLKNRRLVIRYNPKQLFAEA